MGAPVLIGVTGGSCSGKGYLCGRIRESLPPGRCVVLPLDAYYRDLSPLPPDERHRRNFDTPDALDHVLLHEHLEQAASGGVVDLPVYDFSTHTRLPRSERLDAGDKIVLVEGLFSLYWEGIRRFFSLGVFLDLDAETCLGRRIERDGMLPVLVAKSHARVLHRRPVMRHLKKHLHNDCTRFNRILRVAVSPLVLESCSHRRNHKGVCVRIWV